MSRVVDEHRQYLSDPFRLKAFQQAIEETVKPGDVVVDLASGTGIMGLYACKAGARRVYAIDQGGIVGLAREIAKANGFEDRMVFIRDHSSRVKLPELADVVVSDQLSHFGFEAGACEDFADARRRFLKPGGAFIPANAELMVALVEFPQMFSNIDFWSGTPAGFNFIPARLIAANTGYPIKLLREHLLSEPVSGFTLDFTGELPRSFQINTSFRATRPGNLHGVGGWFRARLSQNVVLTNSPVAEDAIQRRNVFFPIDKPVQLAEGDRVQVLMNIVPETLMVSWRVDVEGTNGRNVRFNQSTFQGTLVAREDLAKTSPQFVPKLTPWGQARRSVLDLCDGSNSLSGIEEQLYTRHRDLFQNQGEAAVFAAEVITNYTC